MLQVAAEKRGLREEFDANFKIVTDIEENEPTSKTGAMVDFFVRVCSSLHVVGVVGVVEQCGSPYVGMRVDVVYWCYV
jgi:hypothetical protein